MGYPQWLWRCVWSDGWDSDWSHVVWIATLVLREAIETQVGFVEDHSLSVNCRIGLIFHSINVASATNYFIMHLYLFHIRRNQ